MPLQTTTYGLLDSRYIIRYGGIASGKILISDGVKWIESTPTFPNTAAGTGKILRADGTDWVATTSTFAYTYAVSTILHASNTNVVTGLATGNNGVLVTSPTGVPSISTILPAGLTIPGYTPSTAWTKITADNVTILGTHGTITGTVADLQVAHDELQISVNEENHAPGFDAQVEFINVTSFNLVNILAVYDGSTSHVVPVELFNFVTGRWDTFDTIHTSVFSLVQDQYTFYDYSFPVPVSTQYVGTAGNAGKVRVRFYHYAGGVPAHKLYIDVVALYIT